MFDKEKIIVTPELSKYEYDMVIEQLLRYYNIPEFSTELQEEPISLKDYYVEIKADTSFDKNLKNLW